MLGRVSEVHYRELSELTPDEKEAAAEYHDQSGLYHLACHGDHSMALSHFHPFHCYWSSGQPSALARATQKHELTEDTVLFAGHGNGSAIIGGLGGNPATRFVGLTWSYRGVISTSAWEHTAIAFAENRGGTGTSPVFLEFRLRKGFKLLPMEVLGGSFSSEAECILPAATRFSIVSADYITAGTKPDTLGLILEA
jgi:hypothetical protein